MPRHYVYSYAAFGVAGLGFAVMVYFIQKGIETTR